MRSIRAQQIIRTRFPLVFGYLLTLVIVLGIPFSLRAQELPFGGVNSNDAKLSESQTRIRIAFGGAKPIAWQGEIVFTDLKPGQLQQLSLEPSSVGAAWIEGNRIVIRHEQPIGRDAYDVTLRGSVDSEIEIRLSDGNAEPSPVRLKLSDIRNQAQTTQLADLGRFVAERMPDDRLRIGLEKPTRIYNPGDRLKFTVSPDTEELEPTDFFDFRVTMSRARSEKIIWQSEPTRFEVPMKGTPDCPTEIPLPMEEGVYDIQLTVERPAGFTSRFLPNGQVRPFAQRTFQVLVFDKSLRPEVPTNWQVVSEINPASITQSSRIPEWMDWRRFAWEEKPTRLASFESENPRANSVSLPKAITNPDGQLAANWQAIAMPNLKPGVPHLIEIEHGIQRQDGKIQAQSLGVTVLDKSSQGELTPLTDMLIHNSASWNPEEKESFKILVWPRTNSPLLVVSNPSTESAAKLNKIRIYRNADFTKTKTSQRQLSLRWRNPNLETTVGASLASSSGKLYDFADLQTRYEIAKRIAERVQIAGANGAVIPLNRDGGSITTIPSLTGTPKYNMATWALGTSDLPPIDPIEILLLEFDRRRLDLTPCLALDGPLPNLEKRRRAEKDASYLWSDNLDQPRYNPLHPAVAEEVGRVGREIRTRYEHHRSLGRLSLQLGSQGSLIEPDQEGGFETKTVDRFLKENQLNWPENLPRTQQTHADVIQENVPEVWNSWKQAIHEKSASEIARVYRSRRGQVPLIFSDELSAHSGLRRLATPKLGRQIDLTESFLDLGITPLISSGRMSLVANESLSSPLPNRLPSQTAFWNGLAKQRDSHRNDSPKVNQLLSNQVSIQLLRSSEFFGTPQSPSDLIFNATLASEETAARGLLNSITDPAIPLLIEASGSEQGWYSEELITLRKLFTSMPSTNESTNDSSNNDIEVAVSEQSSGKAPGTVLVAANRTAWKRRAFVTIEVPQRSLAIPINSDFSPEWFETGKHALTLELEPFEAIAWRFSSKGIQCVGTRIGSSPTAVEEIKKQVERLKLADHSARRIVTPLSNASFEERAQDGQAVDWELSNALPTNENYAAVDGNHVLAINSDGTNAVAASQPFPLPSTGQLAIQFQATSVNLKADSEFIIEFSTVNENYQSRTTVSADQLPIFKQDDADTWTELIFAVDDLPIDLNRQMQVRFVVVGKGTVLIDNLRCEDLMLPLPAYFEDTKSQKLALVQLKLAAEQALEEGRLADCQQILDSYWGKFLVTNFPQLPPAVQQANTEKAEATQENKEAEELEEESVADRFRGYWPKIWR